MAAARCSAPASALPGPRVLIREGTGEGGGLARRREEGGGGKVRGGVGAEQHGRRPRAPTFKSGRDGVTERAASHVTPHAPSRVLARSRVGSAGAGKSGFPLGVASWAEDPASGRSRISSLLYLVALP